MSQLVETPIGVQALSEAKSLRWSYLATFPIVLLAIWAVVSVFIHSERARLVDMLTACVAVRNPAQSQGRAPPDDAHARAAARSIFRRSRIADPRGRPPGPGIDQRTAPQMAESTHFAPQPRPRRQTNCPPRRRARRTPRLVFDARPRLARRTTERILSLANTAEPDDTLDFATHCESLLAAAGVHPFDAPRKIVPVASAAIDSAPPQIFDSPSQFALESIVPDEPRANLKRSRSTPHRSRSHRIPSRNRIRAVGDQSRLADSRRR